MKSLAVVFVLAVLTVCVSANPILVKVINEYQVAPESGERVELKMFQTPAPDTFFDSMDLYGTTVLTPAGSAVINTHLILPGNGYVVIDSTDLSGPFDLTNSAGFCKFTLGWRDSVVYPSQQPTPPSGLSAAFFHGYGYVVMEGYFFYGDWYVDASPTLGAANDDYPGCVINGHVLNESAQPISGVRVIVNTGNNNILPNPPFYKSCTTYTAVDGSYVSDSLLPLNFWVKVTGTSYYPDSYYTQPLTCRTPTTVNFYLTGMAENAAGAVAAFICAPNPFKTDIRFTIHDARYLKNCLLLRIYNANGRLVKDISPYRVSGILNPVSWDGTDQKGCTVPEGVYFAELKMQAGAVVKKIIKTE